MKFLNNKLEEFNNYIKNKKVAILGLGVSNAPLIDYLYSLDSNITVFNNKPIDTLDKTILDKIYEYKLNFSFGENYLTKLSGFDVIFRTPSCRPDLPEIQKEIKRGAILTSEIELVLELCPGITVGITGSDGKTTTSSLIYKILKEQNLNCYLGGNIGTPLFTKICDMTSEDYIILELSSFQLMTMKKSPNIAVITNISPNHLDIHKSYEEYIEAKSNIFRFQNEKDILVLNYDNDITRKFAKQAPSKVIFFSIKEKLEDGIILDNNIIKMCDNGLRKHIISTKDIKLKGIHNIENICAAIAATTKLSTEETQVETIKDFSGINHRLEFVREFNNIKWFNDSIATSPSRTIAGLTSFDENIVLIAGGYDKHLDYQLLATHITNKTNNVILLGQTANKIYNAIINNLNNTDKKINIYKVDSLEQAIKKAQEVAVSRRYSFVFSCKCKF